MIEACPTCLRYTVYVFFGDSLFENRILHQDFWLMHMDLCLDLEPSMGTYLFKICLAGPNVKKVCLTRIKLQLRPCHPGRHGHYTMLQHLKRFLNVGNG